MDIYIALIKSQDVKQPSRLIIRDDKKEMKDYLLSIPAVDSVKTFAVFEDETKLVKYFKLRDLVEFLKD
ncbi:hypothetical protein ES703_96222 [subsurface metagenome]